MPPEIAPEYQVEEAPMRDWGSRLARIARNIIIGVVAVAVAGFLVNAAAKLILATARSMVHFVSPMAIMSLVLRKMVRAIINAIPPFELPRLLPGADNFPGSPTEEQGNGSRRSGRGGGSVRGGGYGRSGGTRTGGYRRGLAGSGRSGRGMGNPSAESGSNAQGQERASESDAPIPTSPPAETGNGSGRYERGSGVRGGGLGRSGGTRTGGYWRGTGSGARSGRGMGESLITVGNSGISIIETEAMERLRTNVGNLAQDEIDSLVKEAVLDAERAVKESGMISSDDLRPAIAGAYYKNTGDLEIWINDINGEIPEIRHPLIDHRIIHIPQEVEREYTWVKNDGGPGTHAEVYAANEILLKNPDANPSDITIYVNLTKGTSTAAAPRPFEACHHCTYILQDFNIISGIKQYLIDKYPEFFRDLYIR